MKIIIINYKLGNLLSLQRALKYIGFDSEISNDSAKILKADKIILPGVGSFPTAVSYLKEFELINTIKDFSKSGKYILGICLGMQLLANYSNEFKLTEGLGLIDGKVELISNKTNYKNFKLPSIGWYNIKIFKKDKIFYNIDHNKNWFYFVHSYCFVPKARSEILAEYKYNGTDLVAAIKKNNIYGFQFHPENSAMMGLEILKNFCHA